jgi:hypothetical protein
MWTAMTFTGEVLAIYAALHGLAFAADLALRR